MTTTERPPRCAWDGCRREAEFGVRLCVPAQGAPRGKFAPIALLLDAKLCAAHFNQFEPQTIPVVQETVTRLTTINKLVPPDFKRAWTERVSLDDPELRARRDVSTGLQ